MQSYDNKNVMVNHPKIDSKAPSILFLCRKYYFLKKMSRIRFHAMKAIGKISDVIWSGPEWENWDDALSSKDNILRLYKEGKMPDMVLCFKPQEIPGIADIPLPTAVNRDEMFTDEIPAKRTVGRIVDNKIDLVISHQKEQLEHPLFKDLPCEFAFIPYCTDSSIFKDYGEKKDIDVLLIGNLGWDRYPLRALMYEYIMKMRVDPKFQQYKIHCYPHPGYRLKRAYSNEHVIHYAKMINASKICLSCSGKYRLKYAKYVEVPACRSLLMADMPCEDSEILKEYIVEIPSDISYQDFCDKVAYYLEHDQERKRLTEKGYRIVKENYTQEHYAQKFISIVNDYRSKHGNKKIWP